MADSCRTGYATGISKGVDKLVKGLGCKCEAREKDHAQSMHNIFTIKKCATVKSVKCMHTQSCKHSVANQFVSSNDSCKYLI